MCRTVTGAHPFYMRLEPNTTGAGSTPSFHGVLFWNSNAMDVILNSSSLTYRSVGGVFDFYFVLGPRATDVVQQYTAIVGRSSLPPVWALGFHQCRWGYRDINVTQAVVDSFAANQLPLDVIWNDIDYMFAYEDFTWDSVRFPLQQVQTFHANLAAKHQRHVCIVDVGIPSVWDPANPYQPYAAGIASSVFVRDPQNSSLPLLSRVWPHQTTAFPDFTQDATMDWWQQQIQSWFDQAGPLSGNVTAQCHCYITCMCTYQSGTPSRSLAHSTLRCLYAAGLWIDMNEPSSFCLGQFNNSCRTVIGPSWSEQSIDPRPYGPQPMNNGQAPPSAAIIPAPAYLPGGLPLETNTINMSSLHSWSQHYNVHNMYGHLEARATQRALQVSLCYRR